MTTADTRSVVIEKEFPYPPDKIWRVLTEGWIHIVFGIPILGYIYSRFEKLPQYAPATRFVFLPTMVLSGL